jgi:ribosome maturation factor RimP
MARIDALREIVAPVVDSLGLQIYDLDFNGGVLKLTVDTAGGVDLDAIAEVTRQVSRQLDLDDPIPGKYTLEVSSPGLERTLRLPEHWATAVGELVRVKLKPAVEGERRLEGTVSGIDGDRVTLDADGTPVSLQLDDVERARTVFTWGPTSPPDKSGTNRPERTGTAKETSTS